jgi:hypothetical protein
VFDYPLGSLGIGSHRLKIVTDHAGVIYESSESDNACTKTIKVRAK